jgi:hypothetical protein
MGSCDATLEKTLFIGQCSGEPIPLPYDELLAHHAAVRDAIADAVHIEHTMLDIAFKPIREKDGFTDERLKQAYEQLLLEVRRNEND